MSPKLLQGARKPDLILHTVPQGAYFQEPYSTYFGLYTYELIWASAFGMCLRSLSRGKLVSALLGGVLISSARYEWERVCASIEGSGV